MDKAMELATSWGLKLQGVLEQYGPKVADLALTLGRLDALKTIIVGLVLAAVPIIFWGFLRNRIWNWASENNHASDGFSYVCAGLLTFGSLIPILPAFFRLTDVYAWAGIFRPEIYLAAKALGWT